MTRKLGFRIWLLIILVFLSLIAIFITPHFGKQGVLVGSVVDNSTAHDAGFRKGQVINSIEGQEVGSIEDYTNIVSNILPSEKNKKINFITSEGKEIIYYSNTTPEIVVDKVSKTNLKTGLDLAGGSRALIEAKNVSLNSKQTRELADVLSQRLNVYGLEDVDVSPVTDLQGNNRIKIEIAGANPENLKELISEQGKFEAKIRNQTVFTGGNQDISSVAKNPPNAVIESCSEQNQQHYCNFRFAVYLSQNAAEKHAEITEKIPVNASNPRYLEEPLDLYLDNKKVSSLMISKSLKGRVTTQISISGSETAGTRDEAYKATQEEMKKLQTVLITGSLPYKLEIVKLDTISPELGDEFVKSILLAGFVGLVAVSVFIFFRYKKPKTSISLMIISFSEVIIILGIAAMIEWNLDLPSIAGILVTIGTGLDDLVILMDESKDEGVKSLKQRLKRAFAIIMGAYFTAVVAMLPLMWAGAGLLKGFAITTIIGVSVGVLITRPAFSDLIKRFEK